MLQFKDHVLLERVFGNTGWVYHRTRDNPSKYGIKGIGIQKIWKRICQSRCNEDNKITKKESF
jgi:hypothetical protein